jgi:hypothetical protein
VAIDPEYAAFFVEMIGVQGIGPQRIGLGHRRSSLLNPLHNSFIKEMRVRSGLHQLAIACS